MDSNTVRAPMVSYEMQLTDVADLSSAGFSMAAIKTDGNVWTHGGNDVGQLGNGTYEFLQSWQNPFNEAVAVSVGAYHMLALKEDGTLWAWGGNSFGQLGTGSQNTGNHKSPVMVMEQIAVPNSGSAEAPMEQDPVRLFPGTTKVSLDGTTVELGAYTVYDEKGNGTNYVKLRDVAALLNGTPAQFEVTWDGGIQAFTGEAYTPAGGELTPLAPAVEYAPPAQISVAIDGTEVPLEAYLVAGNYYFKLRDLGYRLHFNVFWKDGMVRIDSGSPYLGWESTR